MLGPSKTYLFNALNLDTETLYSSGLDRVSTTGPHCLFTSIVMDLSSQTTNHSETHDTNFSLTSSQRQNANPDGCDYIDRLPFELLSDIFLLARVPSGENQNPLNLGAFPWVLCNVCRRWRAIAEVTPPLWRSVNIHVTSGQLYAFRDHEKLVLQKSRTLMDRWLSLARQGLDGAIPGSGIDISVSAYNIQRNFIPLYVVLITALLPYSQSWRSLSLRLHSGLLRYFDISSGRVPRLEILQLFIIRTSIEYENPYCFPLFTFRDAPKLKTLEIRGLSRSMWQHISLPWSQLDELDICEVENLDSFCALRLATSVTSLYIQSRIDVPPGEDLDKDDVLHSTTVRRLEYRGFSAIGPHRNDDHLFCFIRLPALTELAFGPSAEVGTFTEAITLIRKSEAKITTLDVRCPFPSEFYELAGLLDCVGDTLKSFTTHLLFASNDYTRISNDTVDLLVSKMGRRLLGLEKVTLVLYIPEVPQDTDIGAKMVELLSKFVNAKRNRTRDLILDIGLVDSGSSVGQKIIEELEDWDDVDYLYAANNVS
ncbi:hypothetical protein Moror_3390 [Moniliophthora roreri MCA 2997]|uniref:Uncharacterized protein n=2 Tax=Moniliophthora roreri TaxID=221103 RepID=V2X2C4_MONRO|nr:hypothetical protein Moror_3390 [Moniliophthora roreri MCA 2997]